MTEPLTEEDLQAIEARVDATIAGPWTAFVEGRDHTSGDDFIRTAGLDNSAPDLYLSLALPNRPGVTPAGPNDLDFVAAARQDIPRLLNEVRRLRSLLD